jgi:hypothetical protein
MGARNVVVVMPFGGEDNVERRRAILNFKRLEYLVRSRCKVKSASSVSETDYVVYGVQVAKTAMEDISDRALRQIQNADILIALITETNPNVIYEVAYRRAKDRTVILVVDSPNYLPVYLTRLGRQSWKQKEVLERIEKMAIDHLPELPDFTVGIPNDLKADIDRFDAELEKGLQEALLEIEAKFEPEPIQAVQYLRGIISDETSSFYPCSIVEVAFSKRGEFANPKDSAIVCDFDDRFSRLYGYVDKAAAEHDKPLTLIKLLERIEKFSDKDNWDQFMLEQKELTETVIKERGFARVTVPLRFNEEHHDKEYRGASFLPCIIAQVIDGSPDESHKMYLLVVYIEIPNTLRPDRSTS